ncbi:hypothetical protein [Sphingorhabdus sp. EL138]|uniref:hypothetical protein n=1 Tax=Sphingorhabdus sp. EL138 TaxID=2073156 RepID=UPI0025F73624|nr:hypothetical protein [Sphingorhabdus sp. EL138]
MTAQNRIDGVDIYASHNFVIYCPDCFYAGEFYQHFGSPRLHFIDVMVFVLVKWVLMGFAVNHVVFGNRAIFIFSREGRAQRAAEA